MTSQSFDEESNASNVQSATFLDLLRRESSEWYAKVTGSNKVVTDAVDSCVPQGAQLVKLQFCVKSPESYDRKVLKNLTRFVRENERQFRTADFRSIYKSVGDILRYSMLQPSHALLASAASSFLRTAENSGHSISVIENSFSDGSRYKGLRVDASFAQKQWLLFEVQFHSQETLDADAATHQDYEEFRADGTTPEREQALHDQIASVYATIPDIAPLDPPFGSRTIRRCYFRPQSTA